MSNDAKSQTNKPNQKIVPKDYTDYYCKKCDIITPNDRNCMMCGKSNESVAYWKEKGLYFADSTKDGISDLEQQIARLEKQLREAQNHGDTPLVNRILEMLSEAYLQKKNSQKAVGIRKDAKNTYSLNIYEPESGTLQYEFEGLSEAELKQKIEYYKKKGFVYETNTVKRDMKTNYKGFGSLNMIGLQQKDKNGDMFCKRCESSRIEDTGFGWKCKDCGNTTSFGREGDAKRKDAKNTYSLTIYEPESGTMQYEFEGLSEAELKQKIEYYKKKGFVYETNTVKRDIKARDDHVKIGERITALTNSPYQQGFTFFGKQSCQSCRNVDYNGEKCNCTVSPLYGKPISTTDWCRYHFATLHVKPLMK